MTLRYLMIMSACLSLAACGGEAAAPEPAEDALTTELVDNPPEPPAPVEPEPLSAEQQAAANAQINLVALAAYRDFAEEHKANTGSYPATKRSFRSAIGAFEDAVKLTIPEGETVDLQLPEGAEMAKPGRIVYRSDGTDYKLIAQRTGDCSIVRNEAPDLVDPKRTYGPGDCIAYGYWTSGAETW